MLTIRVYETANWEFNFWIRGLESFAKRRSIVLRYAAGRDCPVTSPPGWASLVFSVQSNGSPEMLGYLDIRDGYDEVDRDALTRVNAYFKLNYNAAYLRRSLSPDLFARIHPTGLWFPIRLTRWHGVPGWLIRSVRSAARSTRRPRLSEVAREVRYGLTALRLPRLEYFTETLANQSERSLDLFWKPRAWQCELTEASAQRIEVMRALDRIRQSSSFQMEYGFVDSRTAREHFPEHILATPTSKREYLDRLSRAKVGIVTRGLRSSLNWGLGEHLAMRRFVLCETPVNATSVPLEDGKHAVFFKSDLSDLEEKVKYFVSHDVERERIASAGRAFFDEVCAPDAQVRNLLDVFARLDPASEVASKPMRRRKEGR